MFGIKLYKTYNKVKHILVKPKLKVMFSPMGEQPFYLPPHVITLFNKRMCLPNWMTFRIVNRDFMSKWKYDNPCFESRGYFSIVFFGTALTFYLEIPLDNEDMYHDDEYYEFMMEYLNGVDAGDLKECIKQMGTITQHTKKYGERKYPAFRKEWLKPEWYSTYVIAQREMEIRNSDKDEWILCSAIKRRERRVVDGNPYWEGTNDILDIELGMRHHDIFRRFGEEVDEHMEAQGFYTSKGRFVGREEAAKIAYAAGQIFTPTNRLFSEDLY